MKLDRTLLFRSSSTARVRQVQIEIGEPYCPAKSKGIEASFACELNIDDSGMKRQEITGKDAMQAVGTALILVHFYLQTLAERGELTWENGEPYSFADSPVLYEVMQKAAIAERERSKEPGYPARRPTDKKVSPDRSE